MPLQKTTETSGSVVYAFPTGHRFHHQAAPDHLRALEPVLVFEAMAELLGELGDKQSAIHRNETLSDIGRSRQLEPLRTDFIRRLAAVSSQMDGYAESLDKREATLTRVPSLDPTHSAMAIEDREVRDWWRSLSMDDRTKLLSRIDNEPGHDRLMIALMRAPVAQMQLDHEVALVRSVWNRTKRLDNPVEAEAVDSGRAALDWGRRGLAHVAGITSSVVDLEPALVLRTIVASDDDMTRKGFGVFGFDALQAAQQRRIVEHQQRALAS